MASELFPRKLSLLHQRVANGNEISEISFIDSEYLNRHNAYVASGRQNGTVPGKMIAPIIESGMEEAHDFARRWMPSGNIGTFMPVAV